MKKLILLFGIVAMMAACGGNKASKEAATEESTEVTTMEEATEAVVDSMEMAVDTVAVDTTVVAE